jgi:hypothetical protein
VESVVTSSRLFPELPDGLDARIVVNQSSAESIVASEE